MREGRIRTRVLRQLEDGVWHHVSEVVERGKGKDVTRAEVHAVIFELVWAEMLKERVTHEGPTEQRWEWIRRQSGSNDQT